ncbi:hypothetical protein ACFLYA_01110 [Candidatus Dependentiae bacterium]
MTCKKITILCLLFFLSNRNLYCMGISSLERSFFECLIKSFFTCLYDKHLNLSEADDRKSLLLEKPYLGEEKLRKRVKKEWPELSDSDIDELFTSCKDDRRFNEEWGFIVMWRTPVSVKLKRFEQNTRDVFNYVTGDGNVLFSARFRDLLENPKKNYELFLLYVKVIVDMIFDFSRSLKRCLRLEKRYKKKKKKIASKKKRKKLKKLFQKKIDKYEDIVDDNFEKSLFIFKQVPELKEYIVTYEREKDDEAYYWFINGLKKY